MSTLIIDLTNYKDTSGARVPEGTYRVVVEDAEVKKSKAGNDMVVLYLRVLGGPYDGSTILDRLTLSERALFRVVEFMQGIGLPTPRKRLHLKLDVIIGRQVDVRVEDGEPYNGRIKSEVREYIRVVKPASAEPEDLDPEDEDDDLEKPEAAEESKTPAKGSPKTQVSEDTEDFDEESAEVESVINVDDLDIEDLDI